MDQISKLRNQSAHATSPLYAWAFNVMRGLLVGIDQQRGLFQQVYGG